MAKGAAWSLPVIAVAIASPAHAGSVPVPTPWNVSVTSGCLIGIAGLSASPGFTITETGNSEPPPATILLTQSITYSGSFSWVTSFTAGGTTAAENASRTAANALGRVQLAFFMAGGLTQVQSTNILFGNWTSESILEGPATGSTAIGSTRTRTFTLSRTRTVTLTQFTAGNTRGIGYIVGPTTTLPGASITNSLAVSSDLGGSTTTDNSALLTTALLSTGC